MVSWVRVYMYSISELACGSCLCEPMTSADPHGRCCRHSCDPCAAKISTLCSANSSCSWIRILTRYFGNKHMSACATRLCSCGISICSVNSLLMHANVRQHLTARCSGLLCRQSANEPAVPFQYRYAPKPCSALVSLCWYNGNVISIQLIYATCRCICPAGTGQLRESEPRWFAWPGQHKLLSVRYKAKVRSWPADDVLL